MSQISPLPSNAVTPAVPAVSTPASGSTSDSATASPAAPASTSASSSAKTSAPAAPTPDQRLLIQETGEMGVFVYTVVDRASGTVVAQIPYKQVEELGSQENYASGQVISTTA